MSKPISVKPSAAFFCPVPFLVHAQYLADLRTRIVNTPFLGPLGDAIRDIHTLWESLASDKRIGHVLANEDDRTRAADFVQGFQSWIDTGAPGPIASQPSTVVSFPLLLVTGVCQWCMYLELSHQSQAELVGGPLRVGGVQGYCGGTLSALAVASAADEEELGRRAASMFRVAFMMGLLMSEGETGPEENVPDMVIVRLKYPGQDREFMEMFPGVRCLFSYPTTRRDHGGEIVPWKWARVNSACRSMPRRPRTQSPSASPGAEQRLRLSKSTLRRTACSPSRRIRQARATIPETRSSWATC